jgi:hypothetical protein
MPIHLPLQQGSDSLAAFLAGSGLLLALGLFAALALLALGLLALALWLTWLTARAAAAVPKEHRRLDPGLAWLLLIPVANLALNFVVLPRISQGQASAARAAGLLSPGQDAGESLGWWFSAADLGKWAFGTASVAPLLGGLAGFLGTASLFGSLVLYILWLVKACEMRRLLLDPGAGKKPLPPGPIVG